MEEATEVTGGKGHKARVAVGLALPTEFTEGESDCVGWVVLGNDIDELLGLWLHLVMAWKLEASHSSKGLLLKEDCS